MILYYQDFLLSYSEVQGSSKHPLLPYFLLLWQRPKRKAAWRGSSLSYITASSYDRRSGQELTADPGGRNWRSYQWVLLTGSLFMTLSVFFLILPITACPGVESPIMVAPAPHSASPLSLPKHRISCTGWLWTTNYRALFSIWLSSSKSRLQRGWRREGGNR